MSMASLGPVAILVFQNTTSDPPCRAIIPLQANSIVRVGRDAQSNDFQIEHEAVSRNHLEFYSILYDAQASHCPLVYVRDRQSANGTLVNGNMIGKKPLITAAWLLNDNDQVQITPQITFLVKQAVGTSLVHSLSALQEEEIKMFKDSYSVTARTIGDGAWARAYLAWDARTGKQLICKVHDLDDLKGTKSDPLAFKRAIAEVEILSQLDHPNILSLKRAYRTPHTLYTITELATGGDLFSLTERKVVFTERETQWLVHQIIQGVAYLHDKGIVHRDLKPENILCAICPKVEHRLLIADFGCAGVTSRGRLKSDVGTQQWKPPDGCRDKPLDMWAIGGICLYLLLGREDRISICEGGLGSLVEAGLDFLISQIKQEHHGAFTEHGENFIRRCLESEPSRRITAHEAKAHDWFHETKELELLFQYHEKVSSMAWKPRTVFSPIIENLPDLLPALLLGGSGQKPELPEIREPAPVTPSPVMQSRYFPTGNKVEIRYTARSNASRNPSQKRKPAPRLYSLMTPLTLGKPRTKPSKPRSILKAGSRQPSDASFKPESRVKPNLTAKRVKISDNIQYSDY